MRGIAPAEIASNLFGYRPVSFEAQVICARQRLGCEAVFVVRPLPVIQDGVERRWILRAWTEPGIQVLRREAARAAALLAPLALGPAAFDPKRSFNEIGIAK